jgi:hypothetical protein
MVIRRKPERGGSGKDVRGKVVVGLIVILALELRHNVYVMLKGYVLVAFIK